MADATAVPDADRQPADPGVRVYAPPRRLWQLCGACFVFFLVATVGGVWLPLANPDGSFRYPVPTAIGFGCFWGGWAALSLMTMLAYRRMRVFVSAEVVQVVGLFRTRTFALPTVSRARWRGWPAGGSLVLYSPAGRAVVEFASYTDGAELAQFFRAALPPEVQHRFERFEATAAPASEAFRQRSERELRMASVLMPVVGVGMFGLAVWGPFDRDRTRWLCGIAGALCVLIGACQRFSSRRVPHSTPAAGVSESGPGGDAEP